MPVCVYIYIQVRGLFPDHIYDCKNKKNAIHIYAIVRFAQTKHLLSKNMERIPLITTMQCDQCVNGNGHTATITTILRNNMDQ